MQSSPAYMTILVLLWAALCPAAWSQSDSFESVFRHGTEAMRAGNLDVAAQDFSRATKLNPSLAEAFFNLALVQLQQKDYAGAISSLDKAVILKPRLRAAHMFLGIANYRVNNYDKAIVSLKRETEITPTDAQALMWLGVAQLAKGDNEAAVESLDKAAKL